MNVLTGSEIRKEAMEIFKSSFYGIKNSEIFPDFENENLDYGIIEEDNSIFVETKFNGKNGKLMVKISVSLEEV